jgi:hypothetical protein
MDRNLLKSTLHNISEIQSIPREQRTVKQEKALTRMQTQVRQSRQMRSENGSLPTWWKQLECDPVFKRQIELCINAPL